MQEDGKADKETASANKPGLMEQFSKEFGLTISKMVKGGVCTLTGQPTYI